MRASMSLPDTRAPSGECAGTRALRRPEPLTLLYAVFVGLFLAGVATYYEPGCRFTRLVLLGDTFAAQAVPRLKALPHWIEPDSNGYDGQFYAQIALHPLLDEPALVSAMDDFGYRSKRVLFSWTAWVLGLGRSDWVLTAFSLQNVVCWLVLAGLLLRWFPPVSWENFVRWLGILFGYGALMSVRASMLEGPSVLMLVLAVMLVERGARRGAFATIALATLGKETNLLSVVAAAPATRPWIDARAWLRWTLGAALAALPLLAWVLSIWVRFRPASVSGLGTLRLPLTSYVEKWADVARHIAELGWQPHTYWGLFMLVALTAQAVALLAWRRWTDPWWRLGAIYLVLGAFLGPQMWFGVPGSTYRVLLPMTVAFNFALPSRGWRSWPLLVLGNLGVLQGFDALRVPLLRHLF